MKRRCNEDVEVAINECDAKEIKPLSQRRSAKVLSVWCLSGCMGCIIVVNVILHLGWGIGLLDIVTSIDTESRKLYDCYGETRETPHELTQLVAQVMPKRFCQYAHGMSQWETEYELLEFEKVLHNTSDDAAVVELGAATGRNTAFISKLLDAYAATTGRPRRKHYIYDAFSPNSFPECDGTEVERCTFSGFSRGAFIWILKNIDTRWWVRGYFIYHGITLPDYMYRGFFGDVSKESYPSSVAFAVFDSDAERSTRDSFLAVYPSMVPGGTVLMHDYHDKHNENPCCPGVKAAMVAYLKTKGCRGDVEEKVPGSIGILRMASVHC